MKPSQYGPCGLFCGACGATDCDGCQSDRIDDSIRQCKFRRCSADRGLDSCARCPDGPCQELLAFMSDQWPHHWTMQPNLEYIRRHGIAQWLRVQEQQWTCSGCGAGRHWYKRKCECGQDLDGFEPPAQHGDPEAG